MVHLITIISKYTMLAALFFYTIGSFYAIRDKTLCSDRPDRGYPLQMAYVVITFLAGYAVILMHELSIENIILFAVELLFLLIYPMMLREMYPKAGGMLLCHMMMFLSIGFIMICRLSQARCKRQVLIVIGAAIVTCWIPKFIEKLKNSKIPAAAAGVIGLGMLVLVLVLGNTEYGANLSLTLGSVSIQPSELVKITYVLLIAMLFRNRSDFKRVFFATVIASVHVVVLVASKDLGAALIYFAAYLCMLLVATRNLWYPFLGIVLGSAASVGAYFVFSHVRTRVAAWVDPWSIIDGDGYQITQSLFAIGSGGFLGSGLYQGLPEKIPVVVKDFMFSAIAEELGGIYAICLIFAILSCLLLMIKISARVNTLFYKLAGLGFAAIYGLQVFITIGGAIKLIPSTGVTLPFISYGGSSVFSMFVIFMIMQGLMIMRRNEDDDIEREEQKAENARRLRQDGDEIVVYFED